MDHGDVFYIKTNSGARDFEIVVAPAEAPVEANWRAFLPAKDGRLIETAALFKDYLVLLAREENVPRLIVHELASGRSHEIAFEAQTYFLKLETVYEFDSPVFRFSYSSMACSQETYDYDMAARQRLLLKKQMTPKDFDAAAYVVRSVLAPTPDGETTPISLLYRRDTPIDGTAPMLIYGYGAYGRVMDANFSTNRLSLVDRGFVYAIAHVRGGTEKGWRWYEEGKLAQEANTFSDFLAATRHLVARGLCRRAPHRRAWRQRGRNVDGRDRQRGAGTVRRHHRRRAVRRCAQHDARRQPAAHAARMAGMGRSDPRPPRPSRRSAPIQPYDNVRPQRYPAILALAGLTDPRVTYWEPAKWVARLRATMTGGGPILLRTAMERGPRGRAGTVRSARGSRARLRLRDRGRERTNRGRERSSAEP